MRKPCQELRSPAKCLGGGNRGSATEVGLLPLGGERKGNAGEPFKELADGTHHISQELRVSGH